MPEPTRAARAGAWLALAASLACAPVDPGFMPARPRAPAR